MYTGFSFSAKRPALALALLVCWLFAYANVMAHELVIEHRADTVCEWHCQNKITDDYVPCYLFDDTRLAGYHAPVTDYDSVTPLIPFRLPHNRAPPLTV